MVKFTERANDLDRRAGLTEETSSRVSVGELFAELRSPAYRWWALGSIVLIVAGELLFGVIGFIAGFVWWAFLCQRAVQRIRDRRDPENPGVRP